MTISTSFLTILATLSLVGCAGDKCADSDCSDTGADELRATASGDLEELSQARSTWEGTPEGVGLIEFLNAEDTTQSVLDYTVGLDRRAAGNLIAHRDGGDRLWGTSDDDIYNTVDEADAVRFVGPKTLDRMVDFALRQGFVPGAGEILGVYDGVAFSVEQADATVKLINGLDESTLDIDMGLDARAAASIVDAQPVATIDGLSRLYFVGQSALSILKDAATEGQTQQD
jgi:hypothetical protein